MSISPSRNQVGNAPSGVIRPLVNFTTPDGGIGSIAVPIADTIAETEILISAAIRQALTLGRDVAVRFVSLATGHAVSQVRVLA